MYQCTHDMEDYAYTNTDMSIHIPLRVFAEVYLHMHVETYAKRAHTYSELVLRKTCVRESCFYVCLWNTFRGLLCAFKLRH